MLQYISRLLLAGLLLWIVPTEVWGQTDKWDGSTTKEPDGWSAGNPEVLITKASELAWVAKTTNDGTVTGGNGETGFENCTVKLSADIDLDNQKWPMIGNNNSSSFKGVFDGQGFQVKNLKIDIDGRQQILCAGFFGTILGTIKNLGIVISADGIKVVANGAGSPTYVFVGGLAGNCSAQTIQNSYVTGGSIIVETKNDSAPFEIEIGGLVGLVSGSTIQDCYSTVNIETEFKNTTSWNQDVGGLVGKIDAYMGGGGHIINCFTSGNIDDQTVGTSSGCVGGILGRSYHSNHSVTIENCVTLTTINWENTAGGTADINRILGDGSASISNSYALEGDRITLTNGSGTTTPSHSSVTATSKDGADWDGTTLPVNTLDNSQWEECPLPIMPKLKDTNGNLMPNQSNLRIFPTHTLTLNSSSNGTITTRSGDWIACKNEKVKFIITPSGGYGLKSLTYTSASAPTPTGIDENSSGEYIFTMPNEDVTIAAAFDNIYGITVVPPTNGSIVVEGSPATAFMGDDISFTVSPDAGYELDGTPSVTEDGSGATASCNESNGKYTFVMPAGAVSISATFKEPDPVVPDPTPDPDPTPVPPVYYTVSLPAVDGVITDPVAGEYSVEAWSSFRFYLTLDKEYDQSVPVVTTDRFETITPRSSDGAYIVKYVRNDVEISIDGIVKNPDPVANEELQTEGIRIYAGGGYLHIQTPKPEKVYIFTPDGRLKTMLPVTDSGERIALPKGVYFVKAGERVYKTVL